MEGKGGLYLSLTASLRIDQIEVLDTALRVTAVSIQMGSSCSLCGQESQQIHSHYQRTLADVPCGSRQVKLYLKVRKFFCRTPTCPRKIFTERMPALVQPSARMTNRLRLLLQTVGLAVGGEAGSRLAGKLSMPVTPPTLLRCLRATSVVRVPTVRVLGLDDWSYKRGQTFGTILVDLEHHRVIDLLPDRRSDSVQTWLEKHPEVEIISRDRASGYADAARQGAPQATQVADRFHLVKNLREKLQELLDRKRTCLPYKEENNPAPFPVPQPKASQERGQTSQKASKTKNVRLPASGQVDTTLTANERQRRLNREKRYERYEAVKALRAQGLSHYAIADALGLSRPTVRYFLDSEQFPERRDAPKEPHIGIVTPYLPFLRERWVSGCHNGRQLFREAKARGYMGSSAQLERVTTQWRKHLAPGSLPLKRQRISSQQASWYFVMNKERLTAEQQRYLEHVCQVSPDLALAYELSQDFLHLFREQKAEGLNTWLRQAKESRVAEIRSLAKSMQQDYAAVAAACSLPWNQGQVEGQINRLKWLKRQMYGRARFDLLRLRVLLAS